MYAYPEVAQHDQQVFISMQGAYVLQPAQVAYYGQPGQPMYAAPAPVGYAMVGQPVHQPEPMKEQQTSAGSRSSTVDLPCPCNCAHDGGNECRCDCPEDADVAQEEEIEEVQKLPRVIGVSLLTNSGFVRKLEEVLEGSTEDSGAKSVPESPPLTPLQDTPRSRADVLSDASTDATGLPGSTGKRTPKGKSSGGVLLTGPCPLVQLSFDRTHNLDQKLGILKSKVADVSKGQLPFLPITHVIDELREKFVPRNGDVFMVLDYPVAGIQRLMTALVEGKEDPWSTTILDKPQWVEAAAVKRGVDKFLNICNSWEHRRLFKSKVPPETFPCQLPFRNSQGEGPPPKIIVLVTDPRVSAYLKLEVLRRCVSNEDPTTVLLEAVLREGWQICESSFEFMRQWSEQERLYPDQVRLVDADKLASWNPEDVKNVLIEIAEFVELPNAQERAINLATAAFSQPANATDIIATDPGRLVNYEDGQLVEQASRVLEDFEDVFAQLSWQAREAWRQSLVPFAQSSNIVIAKAGQLALQGPLSLPPIRFLRPMKGEVAHNAGMCRPCVFALRGICRKPAGMCAYCHAEGHAKLKRASHATRKRRSQLRARTPPPCGLSD
eukprot:TRINITY_DN75364_c0_g1_i1.p1 TRINITY_DN75364_c0_g1~~TRINITY_DN75364_c0_g1_i1.p1  ORF type:complete len:635 (+),score=140.23 TRINITY_DN75364_c0_g1_i1:84-1907(+)